MNHEIDSLKEESFEGKFKEGMEERNDGDDADESKSKNDLTSIKNALGLNNVAPTRLEIELNEAVKRVDELTASRAVAKKKVKNWTKNFQSAYGRDPTIEEKREQGNDIFVAFANVDNELNIEKKNVKNK